MKQHYAFEMSECYPNPASDKITFNVNIENNTSISILDNEYYWAVS